MLLNWTGKTGKNGFVEFLFSSDGFFFIPILTSSSCVCRFASIFFLKHFLKARLLHIPWTRNHLIRVFAFSQWHFASSFADSDGKFGSYFSLLYFWKYSSLALLWFCQMSEWFSHISFVFISAFLSNYVIRWSKVFEMRFDTLAKWKM